MQIRLSDDLKQKLVQLRKKDKRLVNRAQKQLKLFSANPIHPSLRVHKLSGQLKNMWSISITKGIRMVYLLFDNEAYFFDIGTHDEIYKN